MAQIKNNKTLQIKTNIAINNANVNKSSAINSRMLNNVKLGK